MLVLKKKALKIINVFDKLYPDAKCTLDYRNPWELLVATQLSAQCTDARVNIVTKPLFEKYKKVEQYVDLDIDILEKYIKSTGFFRNKAKNIKNTSKIIVEKHNGEVPSKIEELLELPGVGRKTANVVLGSIFNVQAIVIDTHAKRLSKRIGFTKLEDPVKIEYELMEILPKESWTKFCHQYVLHGRAVCKARKPLCDSCDICMYCDFFLS